MPRVVGHVDASGTFTRVFTTTTLLNNELVNSAVSDGTNYWVCGKGNDFGSLTYMGPGAQAQVSTISSIGGSFWHAGIAGGQLSAVATGSGNPPLGVYDVGSGVPTTGPQTLTSLLTTPSGFGFAMNPTRTICYRATGNAVQKWTMSNGTWVFQYAFTQSVCSFVPHVCVDWSSASPIIYASGSFPGHLLKWTDTGVGTSATVLATGYSIRSYGISFVPEGCAVGAACDDGDPNTVNDAYSASCICEGTRNRLTARVLLQGPYDSGTGLMNDALRQLPAFPMTEPYTALGWGPVNGATTINASVLATAGPDAVVDWVLVELREALAPGTVVYRRAALLQRDGDIVEFNGTGALDMPAPIGDYHVAVRHRNHFGVMTEALAHLEGTLSVDFSNPGLVVWGTNARLALPGVSLLWQGNAMPDTELKYTGASNDRDPILVDVGGSLPTNTVAGYYKTDTNLDGTVKYTGVNNDRDPILVNIGGNLPTNVRVQQLP